MTRAAVVAMRARVALVTAIAVTAALALAGCQSQKVRSTEDWLADQPFVLGVEILDSEVDDWGYSAVMRAELDPLATTEDIEKLIGDTIKQVGDDPDDDLGIQFGILGIDFDVTTKSKTQTAFELWRDIDDVPDLTSALVFSDFIFAHTPRETLVSVFDELADFGVGVRVEGDQESVASAVELVLPRECEPAPGVRELATAEVANVAVEFGTYDLCEGFNVAYVNGTPFVSTISTLLAALDASALGEFPVRLAVSPVSDASADYHIAEITPGPRDVFDVLAALDASAIAMRYELLAPVGAAAGRELRIESSEATAEDLYKLLLPVAGSALLADITIVGSDEEVSGTLADLTETFTPAPTATPTPTPTPAP